MNFYGPRLGDLIKKAKKERPNRGSGALLFWNVATVHSGDNPLLPDLGEVFHIVTQALVHQGL